METEQLNDMNQAIIDPPVEDISAASSEESGSQPDQDVDVPATDTDADKGGVQKRIDKLTKQREEAIRDSEFWRGKAEAAAVPPKPEPEPESTELDPDNFDTESEYLKAVAKQTQDEIRAEATAEKKAKAAAERGQKLSLQYQKAKEKYADFDEIALPHTHPVTADMTEAAQGDNFADILYHLGKNPSEARRIALLPAVQQIKEIGRIEAVITANPKPKTKTDAPNPPSTLDGGGGSPPVKPDSEKSRSELHKEWEADRLKKAGVG